MSLTGLLLAAAAALAEPAPAPAPPAAPLPPAPVADPLAPARAGRLQCFSPDEALRTCGALSAYTLAPDGGIVHRAEVVISPAPFTTMTTSASVRVRGPAVCGRMTGAQAATFRVEGKPVDEAATAELRARIGQAFAAFGEAEVCTTYVPHREGFMALVTIGGAPRSDLNQPVIWVRPEEGYAVAP